MPKVRLTEKVLVELSLPQRGGNQVAVYDSVVENFGVRVTNKGTKTFFIWYRDHGVARRKSIGRFPECSLKTGRTVARDLMAEVRSRRFNASGAFSILRAPFAKAIDDYLEHHLDLTSRNGRERARILRNDVEPLLGKIRCDSVGKREIEQLVSTLRAKRAPTVAIHAFDETRSLFSWLVSNRDLPSNPTAKYKLLGRPQLRQRVLTNLELRSIWRAAVELGYPYGHFVRLLILTGQRRTETANLRWEHIDRDLKRWVIPSNLTKNRRSHTVPLAETAFTLLEAAHHVSATQLFSTKEGRPISGFSKWKRQIDFLSGVHDWRLHDLRRTVATRIAEANGSAEIAHRILNHYRDQLSRTYVQTSFVPQMQIALEIWEKQLLAIVEAGS